MKLIIAPRALRDLDDIEYFTARRWGDDQAVRYLKQLRLAFERVADIPALGRVVRGSDGLSTYRRGSHVLAFRAAAAHVEIVRVLHQSMDLAARLAAER